MHVGHVIHVVMNYSLYRGTNPASATHARARERDTRVDPLACLSNKFTMICTHLVCEIWPNYPGANVVGAALKFRKRNGNLSLCVHVLHKTLNLVTSLGTLSRDDDDVDENET